MGVAVPAFVGAWSWAGPLAVKGFEWSDGWPAVPEGERQGGARQTAVKGGDRESGLAAWSVEVRGVSNGSTK